MTVDKLTKIPDIFKNGYYFQNQDPAFPIFPHSDPYNNT